MIAFGAATMAALRAFRYNSETGYFAGGAYTVANVDKKTNYWKTADPLMNYTMMAVWGLAGLTQILSMLGIAVEINLIVWFLVVPYIAGPVGMVYNIMMFLGLEGNHSECVKSEVAVPADITTNAASASNVAYLAAVAASSPYCAPRGVYRSEWYKMTAEIVGISVALAEGYESWFEGQMALLEASKGEEEEAAMEEEPVEEEAEEEEGEAEEEVEVDPFALYAF